MGNGIRRRAGWPLARAITCAWVLGLSGCVSIGPDRVVPDRIDYVKEIGESWKQQMLLNIVKMRYFDPPTFLDVTSVINQYGIENQVSASMGWLWPKPSTSALEAQVGGYARYSDKPTISYAPLSGHKFTQSLLTPIPPAAIIRLIQCGWPVDMIFSLAIKKVNGVTSLSRGADAAAEQEKFTRLVQALRTLQVAGVTDMRVDASDTKDIVVFVISETADRQLYAKESEMIRSILRIKPGLDRYKVVFGGLARNDDEIALLTRSMLELILEMSLMVDVPEKHIAENRVNPAPAAAGGEWSAHIRSSKEKPNDAFAMVSYQDYWFWIDNKDAQSKRSFALLMVFMSLTESEQKAGSPLFTIGN